MFASNAYNYINVLDKAADAAWQRHELISNNIANQDTPGYKRQDIDFESQLAQAMKQSKYTSIDSKVSNLNMNRLKPRSYTDYENYSYRLDENNVDIQVENVNLAKNQLKYNGLMTSVRMEFQNLINAMK